MRPANHTTSPAGAGDARLSRFGDLRGRTRPESARVHRTRTTALDLRTVAAGPLGSPSSQEVDMTEAGEGSDTQVVVITGATSGIGQATARLLSARGYRVFGTSRHPSADRIDGYKLLPLEVTSDESVRACLGTVSEQTGGRVDVLVNNVGTGILGAAEESSA